MDPEKLRLLLSQNEGPTLEFKKEWYKLDDPNGETKTRQKHELVKDVLSLANGNSVVAGETAYLIIGADDDLNADGSRDLYDVGSLLPTEQRILQIVNWACYPPLEDVKCSPIELDGKRILVIVIPFSPHLHETTCELKTPSRTYTEHVVFVRHNESVRVASAKERAAILDLKRVRFTEMRNAPPVPFGAAIGAIIGGSTTSSWGEKLLGKKEGRLIGGVIGVLAGGAAGAMMGNVYKDAVEIRYNWHRVSAPRRVIAAVAAVLGATGLWIAGKLIAKFRISRE